MKRMSRVILRRWCLKTANYIGNSHNVSVEHIEMAGLNHSLRLSASNRRRAYRCTPSRVLAEGRKLCHGLTMCSKCRSSRLEYQIVGLSAWQKLSGPESLSVPPVYIKDEACDTSGCFIDVCTTRQNFDGGECTESRSQN